MCERRTAKFLSIGAALPLILRHSVRFQMLMRFATCSDAQPVSDVSFRVATLASTTDWLGRATKPFELQVWLTSLVAGAPSMPLHTCTAPTATTTHALAPLPSSFLCPGETYLLRAKARTTRLLHSALRLSRRAASTHGPNYAAAAVPAA